MACTMLSGTVAGVPSKAMIIVRFAGAKIEESLSYAHRLSIPF
jgi:hypothetical protein